MSDPQPPYQPEPARWNIVFVVLAAAAGSLLYKVLMHRDLGHSSAMFIGIPVVISILLAMAPRAKTVTGRIVVGITFSLLILAPLLGEGYLCILIASPLFYLFGIITGLIVDHYNKKRKATLGCIAIVVLPMCLEGVIPGFNFNRAQTVTVTQTIAATPQEVKAALAESPHINTPFPAYLRIGFPTPVEAHGTGLAIGDTRTIHFTGAEGDPPGDLIMHVTAARPGYVRFDRKSDASKLTQWLDWRTSEITWQALSPTQTTVTWTIHFDRKLDPAWYFIPWERSAVHEAAAYLIQANATPYATNPGASFIAASSR
jgi:hypothetical protein